MSAAGERALWPWHPGQFVAYHLERDDDWVSYVLQLEGPFDDHVWGVFVEARTGREAPESRSRVVLRVDTAAPDGSAAIVPVKLELLQGEPKEPAHQPATHAAMAMNLVALRRSDAAVAALAGPGEPAALPFGVDRVWPHDDPWPELGKVKRHGFSPRVPVTSIAASEIVGASKGRLTLVAYGQCPPNEHLPGLDYADWSLQHRFTYGGFSLEHPATWSSPVAGQRDDGAEHLRLRQGGNSGFSMVTVSLPTEGEGPEAFVAHHLGALQSGMEGATIEQDEARSDGHWIAMAHDRGLPMGYSVARVLREGGRAAVVRAVGLMWRTRPGNDEEQRRWRATADAMVRSFRLHG